MLLLLCQYTLKGTKAIKVLIVCNQVTVILAHSVSNMLLLHDLVTPVLKRFVHHCRGLWLGNNPFKCGQVVQVSHWYLVMNHPGWTHAVKRILNSVLFQGLRSAKSSTFSAHLQKTLFLQMKVRELCTLR